MTEKVYGLHAVRALLLRHASRVTQVTLIESREPRVEVRVLPRAGHWLHADDLDGLVDAVAPLLAVR